MYLRNDFGRGCIGIKEILICPYKSRAFLDKRSLSLMCVGAHCFLPRISSRGFHGGCVSQAMDRIVKENVFSSLFKIVFSHTHVWIVILVFCFIPFAVLNSFRPGFNSYIIS